MKTKRAIALTALLAGLAATTAQAHDMFLKLPSFFLEPDSEAVIALLNGTFDRSENPIARDRMIDVSVVGPAGTVHPPESAWEDRAAYRSNPDSVDTSFLRFETRSSGTYAIGVSTAETVFSLSAEDFNGYLSHDGVVDILKLREEQGILGEAAVERYSKHVKAIVQVGEERSEQYWHQLDYPIEFIPLENPYEKSVGDILPIRLIFQGHPVQNHPVYASHEGYHGHDDEGGHLEAVSTRTNAAGDVYLRLSEPGIWYVRTIHMVEATREPDIDYESHWATLTFEVRRELARAPRTAAASGPRATGGRPSGRG